ncbi:MAG: epsilon-lactone hydrolase [Alphaproteobacteria bacterium]|nr:epsilon-lactone hydrolase [Alphaproteobacteria bacterium]
MAAKKPTSKKAKTAVKAAAKKPAAKKAVVKKKPVAKKPAAKKPAAKKPAAKKAVAKKTAAKKPAAKKTAAKKPAAKKTVAKKPAAKKKPAKKASSTVLKKTAVKKPAVKKPAAKKPAAKPAVKASGKPSAATVAVYNHIRKIMRSAGEGGDPVKGLRKSFDDYAKVSEETMKLSGSMNRLTVDGVPCAWHTNNDTDSGRRLMYLHGGGYMAGGLYSHSALCSRLARSTGCAVLAVDYRLMPEHPFPAPVEDAVKVFKYMLGHGPHAATPARRTFISGDSAGGGLTLATCMALRDAKEPLPTAAIPISAWTDLEGTGASMKTRARIDPIAGGEGVGPIAAMYLNGKKAKDIPLASPFYGNFKGLPPLLFHVGDAETLLDDSVRCHEKAKAAGVKSKLEVYPHMPHVWHLFAPYLPDATKAIDGIGKFVRSFS